MSYARASVYPDTDDQRFKMGPRRLPDAPGEHGMTAPDRAPSRASAQLARLHALTLALAGALSGDAVADAIVDHVLPALGTDAGLVALLDDTLLTVVRASGALAAVVQPGQRLPLDGASALAEAVRLAEPLILENREARHARFPGMAEAEQRAGFVAGAGVALPLLAGDRAIGAIGLSFPDDRSFNDDERAFLAIVAQQCGQALDRARRYDEAQREIAARAAVEADLREARRRTEGILAGIGDAFFALDRDWRYSYVNAAAATLQGVQPEDLLGRVIWEVSPRAPLTPFGAAARRAMAEGAPVREEHLSPVDGSWYETYFYPTDDGLLVFGRDISAEKTIAAELDRSRLLFERIAQATPGLLALFDPRTGANLFINDGVHTLLGYTPAQMADYGDALLGAIAHPDDISQIVELNSALGATADGAVLESEFRLRHANGSYRWLHAYTTIFARAADGSVEQALTFALDVTARHAIEQALRTSEARWRRLFDANIVGVIAWRLDGAIESANDAFLTMTGYDRDDLAAGRLNWRALTPPGYEAVDDDALAQLAATGRSEPFEKVYLRRDGTPLPVLIAAATLADDANRGVAYVVDLSKRVAVEEALRASEAHLRQLADAMPQIVWESGPDGVLDAINQRWYEFAGVPQDEPIADGLRRLVHPEDNARTLPLWQRAVATGEPFEAQYRLFDRRAGAYRWFLDRAVAMRDAEGNIVRWYGTLTDIDAQRRTQETLAQQARLLDLTYDAIIVHDLEGRIGYWNAAAQALYGYTADEAIGQVSHTLLHTEFPPLPLPIDQLVRQQTFWEGELTHQRRDGSRVLVDSRQVLMYDAQGVPVAVLETNRDITRRKQDEAERAAFISSVTHDLKNPLATIKGQAQLLGRRAARGQTPELEAMRAGLAAIDTTATRMTAMLTELLDVSRMQTGQTLDLALAPTDLVALVEAVAHDVQAGTETHTIVIEREAVELTGIWDAARLERVVGNILNNAVKYTPEGGTIAIRLDAQDLRGARPFAVLTVTDDGVGIPPADLAHVFDWFFRARNVSGRFTGSGIGLPGAKRIIEQHGGSISVASREGVGTTFTIRLPLA